MQSWMNMKNQMKSKRKSGGIGWSTGQVITQIKFAYAIHTRSIAIRRELITSFCRFSRNIGVCQPLQLYTGAPKYLHKRCSMVFWFWRVWSGIVDSNMYLRQTRRRASADSQSAQTNHHHCQACNSTLVHVNGRFNMLRTWPGLADALIQQEKSLLALTKLRFCLRKRIDMTRPLLTCSSEVFRINMSLFANWKPVEILLVSRILQGAGTIRHLQVRIETKTDPLQ